MNIFKKRRCFTINEREPTYKVLYLGNIMTSMTKVGAGPSGMGHPQTP
jgi:hypothetical protein